MRVNNCTGHVVPPQKDMTLYFDSDESSEGQLGNVLAASCHGTTFNRRKYHKLSLDSALHEQSVHGQAVNEEATVNPTFETHVRIELTLSSDTSHMIRDSECDKDKQKQCSRRRSKKKNTVWHSWRGCSNMP